MKHFLLLVAAFISFSGLTAQTKKVTKANADPNHPSILRAFLAPQEKLATEKMVTLERVIGQSTYDFFMSDYSDSVKLNYTTNGASAYDYGMMLYPYNSTYYTSPMFNYLGIFTRPQVEYSNYTHYTVNPNTLVYGFYEQKNIEFDAAFNLTHDTALYADSTLYPNQTHLNKFTAANKIDTSYTFNYAGGVSTPSFRQFFTYNASNKIIKDSIYEYALSAWQLVSKTFYTYDVAGNLTMINNFSNNDDTTYTLPLIEQLRYVNTYDASNRLKTVNASFFDGTALNPYVIDSFAYTGSSTFHTSWKQYQYDGINLYWAPWTYMTKTLNGAGLPDVININTFDSLANMWVPSVKQMAYYNVSNNPTKLDEYIYNFTSFPTTPDFTTRYYYETFNDTTASIFNAVDLTNLTLYPNPATEKIYLKGFEKKNACVTVSLYDVCGKLRSSQYSSISEGELEITLSEFNAGMYVLLVTDESGNRIAVRDFLKVK